MKKSKVLKTKKRSKKGKVILASTVAVLMAVGFSGRSAFAAIFDIIGGQFPWLNSVLGDASGLNLEMPNFDLTSGIQNIMGGGNVPESASKLLRQDGSMNLSSDPLTTISNIGLGSGSDGELLDFNSMNLVMGESSLLTSATAGLSASQKAYNDNEISKKVTEESASVWENSSTPSNSSLEAQEKSTAAAIAAGRAAAASATHFKTMTDLGAIQAEDTLSRKKAKLVEEKRDDSRGYAHLVNSQNTFKYERELRGGVENLW